MAQKPRKRVEGAVSKPEPAITAVCEPVETPPQTLTLQSTARQAEADMATAAAVAAMSGAHSAQSAVAKLANPVPGDDGDALDRIGASFRERFPEDWENIRLCPLQHGIPAMADILRGRG